MSAPTYCVCVCVWYVKILMASSLLRLPPPFIFNLKLLQVSFCPLIRCPDMMQQLLHRQWAPLCRWEGRHWHMKQSMHASPGWSPDICLWSAATRTLSLLEPNCLSSRAEIPRVPAQLGCTMQSLSSLLGPHPHDSRFCIFNLAHIFK